MSKVLKWIKLHWITVWLIAALVALSGFITYASYTGLFVAKRVVSVKEGAGVLFSSNRMDGYVHGNGITEDQINTKHLTTSATGDYTYYLTVCDFAQNDPYTRFGAEIPYTLTARLCVLNGGAYKAITVDALGQSLYDLVIADLATKNFKLQLVSQGGVDVSYPEFDLKTGAEYQKTDLRLTPTGNGTDRFKLVFDSSEFTDNQTYDYYILVKAEPDDALTTLDDIACYLYASKVNVVSSAWTGTLQESGNLGSYDAYNYIIEGSGRATIRLRWNPDVVNISGISLNDMGVTTISEYTDDANVTWNYFEKTVDSSQGQSRYELQVFKTNGEANDSVISQNIIFE